MLRPERWRAGCLALVCVACGTQPLTPTAAPTRTLGPAAVWRVTYTPTTTAPPTETPVLTATAWAETGTPAPVEQPAAFVAQANPPATAPPAGPALTAPDPPTSAPPPVMVEPAGEAAAAEQYAIDLINAQRVAAGVPALMRDETLMSIARSRVADMTARGYTGHNDPVTGVALARAMMRAAGYTSNYLGENWYGSIKPPIALVETAMGWFMTDPPHARNILSPNFVAVGVGIGFNGQQWLLIQNFAGAN